MAEYYNAQLVRAFLLVQSFHGADYGVEDAFELYHKIQEQDAAAGRAAGAGAGAGAGIGLPALGHAVAGSAGTAISHILLYPLDLVITRLQVQKQFKCPREAPSAAREAEDAEYTSLQDAARKIYNVEGWSGFFNGCLEDTGKSILDSFLFFLAYTALRQHKQRKAGSKALGVWDELNVGIAAGAFSKFITTPIQQIVTRKQTAALVSARDPTSTVPPSLTTKLTVSDITKQIMSERGIKGFWSGYSASVILTLNPALTFLFQNLLKRIMTRRSKTDSSPGPTALFLLAAISKALASTITYPFSLAKSRAQASQPTELIRTHDDSAETSPPAYLDKPNMDSTPAAAKAKRLARRAFNTLLVQNLAQLSVLRSLRHILRTEGVRGLYSGLEAEVAKGFLGHGLSMVLKERIHVFVVSVYFFALRLTRRWPEELGSIREQAAKEVARAREVAGTAAADASERVMRAREVAGTAAADASERVRNVTETVAEGVKDAMGGGGSGSNE